MLDTIRYETSKKKKKVEDSNEKSSKALALPLFKKNFSFHKSNKLNEIKEKLTSKHEEIERYKQISTEYQEMIRNLEISIVTFFYLFLKK